MFLMRSRQSKPISKSLSQHLDKVASKKTLRYSLWIEQQPEMEDEAVLELLHVSTPKSLKPTRLQLQKHCTQPLKLLCIKKEETIKVDVGKVKIEWDRCQLGTTTTTEDFSGIQDPCSSKGTTQELFLDVGVIQSNETTKEQPSVLEEYLPRQMEMTDHIIHMAEETKPSHEETDAASKQTLDLQHPIEFQETPPPDPFEATTWMFKSTEKRLKSIRSMVYYQTLKTVPAQMNENL